MDMKKVVLGFILGVITTISVTAIAANIEVFQAQKATFDIYIGNQKFQPENPAIVVEGRTYLPLRATGEALGAEINWNEELKRVEIEKKGGEEMPKKEETTQSKSTNEKSKVGDIFKEFKQILGATYIKEIEGEQYASIGAIGQKYAYQENDNWYVKLPEKEPVILKRGNETTEHSTRHAGNILVKLSSLGLEAEINGDTVILRYK